MAKKGTGTPDKVRQQRESAAAMRAVVKGEHAADILKEIEAAESEAFAKFQDDQRAKREKLLAGVLEPLKTERETLTTTINEANTRIAEIDREVAKLTGRRTARAAATGGGGTRMKKADKEKYEADALAILSKTKDGLTRAQAAANLDITPAQVATILRTLKTAGKAKTTGTKSQARWFAA